MAPSSAQKALIYAALGFVVGAAAQAAALLAAFSLNPVGDVRAWLISVAAGVVAAGLAAATPYLRAALPGPRV